MNLKRAMLALFLVAVTSARILQAQASGTLVVFAASSLTNAFEDIATAFEAANPGVDVIFNFGASSSLATQLVEHAPADVFASANNSQMQVVRDAGRIAGNPVTFAKNRLVLIVPFDNPANIQTLRDLATPGIRLVFAAPSVPVRDYTDTMLERLAADTSYGEAYREAVLANVVSAEDNVRQVAAKVALGEADAGIVYRSDVTPDIADDVLALPIPDALNTVATYPIAVLSDSPNDALAQAFIDFVRSDSGQDTLVQWGFISARIPELPATITLPTEGTTVDGQVLNPLTLTADDLRAGYTALTIDATYQTGDSTISSQFTGVLLWHILSAAQPNFNADVRNDKLSTFIVITGRDGTQAVIAWAEIDPDFANTPVLLAYEQDGAPLDERYSLRLVVPADARDGRYVSDVVNISLRDAPPAAQ